MPELGGSQISALLESVPGIASVLRSPVADAIVNMIRAGAGTGDFMLEDAQELVQYATRRGLISNDEGEQLLLEVTAASRGRKARAKKPKSAKKSTKKKPSATKKAARSKKSAASKARRTTPSKKARSKRR